MEVNVEKPEPVHVAKPIAAQPNASSTDVLPPWRLPQSEAPPPRKVPRSGLLTPPKSPPPAKSPPSDVEGPQEIVMKPNSKYSREELEDFRSESEMAKQFEIRWQDRGPPNPTNDHTAKWRSQAWRENSQRWANRGGSNKEWYAKYYAAVKRGAEAKAAYLAKYPGPKDVRRVGQ